MSRKHERSISAMVFPKNGSPRLKLDYLPTDIHERDYEIAQRFTVKLNELTGENLQCDQRAIEPADILLHDKTGTEIYLQIGEAVDFHRAITTDLREKYGSLLWNDDNLCSIYQGIQVAILDMGEARDLPKTSTEEGKSFLKELSSQLYSLKEIADSLPLNAKGEFKGKEVFFNIHSIPMLINVRLLRYAKRTKINPCKWLWAGTHQVRPEDFSEIFTKLLNKKTKRYGNIKNPFWLLIYSIAPYYEQDTANSLSSMLENLDHPFDRVYLFYPRGISGALWELFPSPESRPTNSLPESKKLLFFLLPQDATPKWDDPRWKLARSNPHETCESAINYKRIRRKYNHHSSRKAYIRSIKRGIKRRSEKH